MVFRALFFTIIAALSGATAASAQEPKVIYYNSSGNKEKTLGFKALKLAFEKIGNPYVLKPSSIGFNTTNAMIEALVNGDKLDILWASASNKTSEKLLAVPFPIDRGLLGMRIMLIDGARQNEFNQVKTLDDLKKFIALQGLGWADVDVLRKAGLTVRTGSPKNLYRMTVGGRGDHFARGAFEAFNEQEREVANVPGLAVEKTILLQYESSNTFYVKKTNTKLRDDILRGLEIAWKDGSYNALFFDDPDVKTALSKGDLKNRTLIKINNPNFPADLAKADAPYWYDPKQ
ncbi:type 2 periplasmic-binding domain-containing protein [Allorhizobium terrae]|uniref:Amino acid ABC transporter substrate-binding protein n=1 Tax=Allorhizobium terrae TaxID=1848972 RepID=A0A4S3ZPC8_9HYPH|nr:diguanylate cyclase [Allorhizobium terrae]THF47341.1 amino acid ABC transporter substrate-binding protein [Allorhizobium terrae]